MGVELFASKEDGEVMLRVVTAASAKAAHYSTQVLRKLMATYIAKEASVIGIHCNLKMHGLQLLFLV